MKITNNKLKRIIKEELNKVLTEMDEMSPRDRVYSAMDELPDAGGSIMGSPGARLKQELEMILDVIDQPEELIRLSAIVQERAAINLLSSLGYEDGMDQNFK
tara:strand:+ start:584 stop:889 length:306 start_codon:yes stop_codon:yes gene_type:complete